MHTQLTRTKQINVLKKHNHIFRKRRLVKEHASGMNEIDYCNIKFSQILPLFLALILTGCCILEPGLLPGKKPS